MSLSTPCQCCVPCEGYEPLVMDQSDLVMTKRSVFWREGTLCSARHWQAAKEELRTTPAPRTCAKCDPNYMFDVLKDGKERKVKSCRRNVRFDEETTREPLSSDQALWEYPMCWLYRAVFIHGVPALCTSREFFLALMKFGTYECIIQRFRLMGRFAPIFQ
jgi:hypothetical protein